MSRLVSDLKGYDGACERSRLRSGRKRRSLGRERVVVIRDV